MTADYEVGLLVKSIRERLGLSQEKLAAKLGVTFTSVNRWENGRRKPSPLAMRNIEDLASKVGLLEDVQSDGLSDRQPMA